MADNEQQDDYLSNMLDAMNEKEQEIQNDINNPEEVARQAKEKLEAENAIKEVNEPEREADADAKLEELLNNTPLEEAAGATLTSDDNSELSDSDMERLMNMNLDDIIDDVKTDSVSIDDLFENAVNQSNADKSGNADSTDDAHHRNEPETDSKKNAADNDASGTAGNDIKADGINAADKKKLKKKPEKEGFFRKIKKVFFDSLEDDKESADDVVKESENTLSENESKDENEQIIEDVFGNKDTLDDSESPKKGFFARFKYRLAQMKAKRIEEEKAEEEAERLDNEEKQKNKELKKAAATEKKEKKKQAAEQKKAAKPKKVKQPKPKKEKKPKEPPKPGDILKIKPLSLVMLVLFVAGVVVLISILNSALYYNTNSSQAKTYYNNGEYDKAYSKLNGMKLNSNDKTLYEQASTIMYVKRQYDSYENYMSLNMKTEALDALIKGIDRYNTFRSTAQELGIDDKFKAEYQNIIDALQNTFKISEAQGISLADMSNSDFTNYYLKIKEYGKAVQ